MLKSECKRLQQRVHELTEQLGQHEFTKRVELQKSAKEKNSVQEQIEILMAQLEMHAKSNDALKSQIIELTADCQTMQRMYKLLESNNDKLKAEFNEKNDELKHAILQSNNFQTANFELALQVKQLEEQLMRVGKSKETIETAKAELLEKFNEYGSFIQRECEDRLETVK